MNFEITPTRRDERVPPPLAESRERRKNGEDIAMIGATIPSSKHPERNEDAYQFSLEKGYSVVCDGMGGHEGGAQASTIASSRLEERLDHIPLNANVRFVVDLVKDTLHSANEKIFSVNRDEGRTGREIMGTTASVLKFCVDGQGRRMAVCANVGDSRIYLFRDRKLHQITLDDSGAIPYIREDLVSDVLDKGQAVGMGAWRTMKPAELDKKAQELFAHLKNIFPFLEDIYLKKKIDERIPAIQRSIELRGKKIKNQEVVERVARLVSMVIELDARDIQERLSAVETKEHIKDLSPNEQIIYERRNEITQALGLSESVLPSVDVVEVKIGDIFLQCTDGPHDNLSNREIQELLDLATQQRWTTGARLSSLMTKAMERSRLAKNAHVRSKPDDISAVITEVLPPKTEKSGTQATESAGVDVSKAKNLRELIAMLEKIPGIPGAKQFVKSSTLITIVLELFNQMAESIRPIGRKAGQEYAFNNLPRTGGFRDHVKRLLDEERKRLEAQRVEELRRDLKKR